MKLTLASLRTLIREALADPRSEFAAKLTALARKNGGRIPATHETPAENLSPIYADGAIRAVDAGVFLTLGYSTKPNFVSGPSVRFLVSIPIVHATDGSIVPDSRFGSPGEDESYAELLSEFPDLVGAEVGTSFDEIPSDWWYAVEDNETGEPIPFD